MKIKKMVSALALSGFASLITTSANALEYLRANGQFIVNEQGEEILLRGMGLGGWMLQEGYMLRLGNLGQQHVIRAQIEALIGAEATQNFYDAWLKITPPKMI